MLYCLLTVAGFLIPILSMPKVYANERPPRHVCQDLLSEYETLPHWRLPKITYYPESQVTYENEFILKGRRNFAQLDVNVILENRRVGPSPRDLHAILKMQIAQNAVPMELDLDKVLQNWGLRKDGPLSHIPPEVEVFSVTPISFSILNGVDSISIQLRMDAPAYTQYGGHAYVTNPTGVYFVTVNFTPNSRLPLSENVRITRVESVAPLKAPSIAEEIHVADPRKKFQIISGVADERYDAINAALTRKDGKTDFKLWSNRGPIADFALDEMKTDQTMLTPVVFSWRQNNLKGNDQLATEKYFTGNKNGADNTLIYVLQKSPNEQGQASLVLIQVSQNPVTTQFDVYRQEYLLPRGYKVFSLTQSKSHVTALLEHLNTNYPSSISMKFEKWEMHR